MKHVVIVLYLVLGLFFLASSSYVNADHGGGTGGGCSGDCTPPTLGTDNAGKQIISGGFAINGNAFDVTYYKQDIPTQTIQVDEPVTVTLTVFENSAPQFLRHVGLMIGLENKFVSGVTVKSYLVQIHWEQDRRGENMVKTDDPDGLVKEVSVSEVVEGKNNVVTLEFTPTQVFDTSTVVVQMWDEERNSWSNYFYDSMRIVPSNDGSGSIIPDWVRTNAGWWAEGSIDDSSFVRGLQYMIKNGIIIVESASPEPGSMQTDIPDWVRTNAGWWAEGSIDDSSFVRGLQYMIVVGIITA